MNLFETLNELKIKINILLLFSFGSILSGHAQLLNENFDYSVGQLTSNGGGSNVSAGAWTLIGGTVQLNVVPGNLSYPNYPSSDIGNKLQTKDTSASAEDSYTSFTPTSSGSIYYSFLINVKDTSRLLSNSLAGDYMAAFLPSTSTTAYCNRVTFRKGSVGNTFNIGLRVTSTGSTFVVWSPDNYIPGTTYLIASQLVFVSGNANDSAYLWVNPNLSGSRPNPDVATVQLGSSTDVPNVGRFAIRQSGGTPEAFIDGIRVGTTWESITGSSGITAPTASAQSFCNAATIADLVVTGASGATFSWFDVATGGTALNGSASLATGTYYVSQTVSGTESARTLVAVTINSLPNPTINVVETSGTTNNDGTICSGASATLTATGGGTYAWSTGATTASISPSPASTTTYTVTVTNTAGCSATSNSTLTVNTLPTPSISVVENSGIANDGNICGGTSTTLTATGGTSYAWSTSATSAAITPSPAATTTYTVTATNANGCSATANSTLTVISTPTASISVVETSGTTNNDGTICSGSSATLTATATGATSYVWSTGATTAAITPSPSSTTIYTVTVSNANGCTGTASSTVTVSSATANISVVETSGTTNNDGTICAGASATLTATGGGTYAWSTGATTASISPSPASTTTYTVTVTNTAGCSATTNSTLTVNTLPTASITVSETSGLQVNDATICTGDFVDLTASGASSVFWNTSATTTTISVNPSSLTTYTATVTDANGCSDSETQSIVVSALPTPSAQSFTICFGDSITVGTNNYDVSGVYTDTFTGINGCDSVVTTTLVVSPQITISQSFTICNGESVSVGTSTYLIAGTYVDTLTATNGCDSLVTTILSVNPVFATNNPIVICFGESYTISDSTYSTSGVYTNLFEAITGCDSTVTTNLTILPLNTHSQTINLCSGETYSIGNNNYSNTGTYIDTLVSAFGCDSIVTTQLTVSSPVNVVTSVNEITITATASNATYQWINCANNQAIAGETSQSYTATVNGEYAVIITQNDCSDTSACTTFSTIGLNELSASFNLYPNPATSTVTIASSQTIDQIFITDLSGKVISILTEKGMNQTIDVSDLSRGMYLVKVNSQGNQITKQFVKE